MLQVLLLKEKLEDRDAEINRLKEELQQQQQQQQQPPQQHHTVDDEEKTELAPEKDVGAEGTTVEVSET